MAATTAPLSLSPSLRRASRLPQHITKASLTVPTGGSKFDPAPRWRELAGSRAFAGLTDPIDPSLRSELTRYGELAQSCYDAFDYDEFSLYCGQSKFDRLTLLPNLGFDRIGYDVSRFIYATFNVDQPRFCRRSKKKNALSKDANWIGYVAVSDDATSARLGRRDIVVSWRGTVTKLEFLADLKNVQRSLTAVGMGGGDSTVKALAGFLDLYTHKKEGGKFSKYSAREQAMAEVKRLVKFYGEERGEEVSISLTGHSLGSALATLSAFDLAELGINRIGNKKGRERKEIPVSVYSFAGPRVGNEKFKERFEKGLGIKCIRVINVHDLVPKVPGIAFNENTPEILRRVGAVTPWSYAHVGVELALDHEKSPYLKDDPDGLDAACYHNLEAYLHLLDGYHGKGKAFELSTGRDLALINKASDFLKDEYLIPANWRQDGNRGMVQTESRRWAQPERTWKDDLPHDMDDILLQIGIIN